MDFTIISYYKLLDALLSQGFSFQTLSEFVTRPQDKTIIIRHDVDARPENSLQFAKVEHKLGIAGTFYFRIKPQSFNEKIIKEIVGLGHEIGYHYESIDTVFKKIKNESNEKKVIDFDLMVDEAYYEFCQNLEIFRKIVPVTTICMHGSPLSKYDNRLIWTKYNYKRLGIIAEPYFDIDFNKVAYLTDTGRRWDGIHYNIRDKVEVIEYTVKVKEKKGREGDMVNSGEEDHMRHNIPRLPFPKFHSTFDIINAAKRGTLPNKIIMTFHPQRWTNRPGLWMKELVWQNIKNRVKYLIKFRDCIFMPHLVKSFNLNIKRYL